MDRKRSASSLQFFAFVFDNNNPGLDKKAIEKAGIWQLRELAKCFKNYAHIVGIVPTFRKLGEQS